MTLVVVFLAIIGLTYSQFSACTQGMSCPGALGICGLYYCDDGNYIVFGNDGNATEVIANVSNHACCTGKSTNNASPIPTSTTTSSTTESTTSTTSSPLRTSEECDFEMNECLNRDGFSVYYSCDSNKNFKMQLWNHSRDCINNGHYRIHISYPHHCCNVLQNQGFKIAFHLWVCIVVAYLQLH